MEGGGMTSRVSGSYARWGKEYEVGDDIQAGVRDKHKRWGKRWR